VSNTWSLCDNDLPSIVRVQHHSVTNVAMKPNHEHLPPPPSTEEPIHQNLYTPTTIGHVLEYLNLEFIRQNIIIIIINLSNTTPTTTSHWRTWLRISLEEINYQNIQEKDRKSYNCISNQQVGQDKGSFWKKHYTSHIFSHHSCTQGSKHNITQPINLDQYRSVMQQIY